MTPKEQREYWLKFHRFQQRQEAIYVPKINKILKEQVQEFIRTKDTVYIRSTQLHGELFKLHVEVGTLWAKHTRSMLLKADGRIGFSERIFQLIRQYFFNDLLAIAEDITQTTIRLIQEVLTRGAQSGASFDDMVKEIESPDFTRQRARLIARTETVGAANQANYINAVESGKPLNKIWIAARDNRTRPDHVAVNQTVIPLHQKFVVGDSLMLYPGDKNGSAAEVCNCRCTVAFIPL